MKVFQSTRLKWSWLIVCIAVIVGQIDAAKKDTKWTVDGRYVMVDGEAFLFKGINYSPIPIGASQNDEACNKGDVFSDEFAFIHERDLPELRAVGANSIRVYNLYPWKYPSGDLPDWTAEADLDHTNFLDLCWNDGDHPIYVWLTHHMGTSFHVATGTASPDGRPTWKLPDGKLAFLDPSWDKADGETLTHTRNAFLALAKKYGNHPAVAGFFISNEQNNEGIRGSYEFWKWFDETARQVKQLAPNKLTGITLVDDALLSVFYAEGFGVDNLEVWGVNSYRGTATTGFDTLFDDYASRSNKPLIIGEYGPPASTRDSKGEITTMEDNAFAQGQYIVSHWNDILVNRATCSGGFVFEWVDEWWKHSDPTTHDASNAPNGAYPGGHGDEEWFGMHSVAMASANAKPEDYLTRGADKITPRAAVKAVTQMFATDVPLPPQRPPSPISRVPTAAPFNAPPSNVPQNSPGDHNPSPKQAPAPASDEPGNDNPSAPTPTGKTASNAAILLTRHTALLLALATVLVAALGF